MLGNLPAQASPVNDLSVEILYKCSKVQLIENDINKAKLHSQRKEQSNFKELLLKFDLDL